VRRALALLVVPLALAAVTDVAAKKPKPRPKPRPAVIHLSAPKAGVYGKALTLRGRIVPAAPNGRIRISLGGRVFTHAVAGRNGAFKVTLPLRSRGPYRAGFYETVSPQVFVTIRPRLEASLVGERLVGSPLALYASLHPRTAGALRVEVFRDGRKTYAASYRRGVRLRLGTSSFDDIRIHVRAIPRKGYAGVSPETLRAKLVPPLLHYGASGAAVTELLGRLRALHIAVPSTSTFGAEVLDSVYAFQKLRYLSRDGVVGPRFWASLAHATIPAPRFATPSDHLEVDKGRQILLVVRGGKVALILPVSTAGISGYYTPEGTFSIYDKRSGFDSSPLGTLYQPMYFYGGYAIHGNPSVPPYPASHGCVRIPMWMADYMFNTNGYGETVYVYS
jgi:peptidoglycan hydrolase-like protein with peptidoglycan-binding domain